MPKVISAEAGTQASLAPEPLPLSAWAHILVNILAFDPINNSLKDVVFSSSHSCLINEKAEAQKGEWLVKVTQQV